MKIELNKVTTLSKAIALALFILLPFIAFILGLKYGYLKGYVDINRAYLNQNTILQSERTKVSVSIEDYIRQNISDLSDVQAVLGGTFYVTNVTLSNGSGVVEYEDGHIALTADFSYSVEEEGDISIDSFVVRESASYQNNSVAEAGWDAFNNAARDVKRIGDMRYIQASIEKYFAKCGHYPGGPNCSTATPTDWDTFSRAFSDLNITIPKEILTDRSYFYAVSPDLQNYIVGARLNDKENKVISESFNIDLIPENWQKTPDADCSNAQGGYCLGSTTTEQ